MHRGVGADGKGDWAEAPSDVVDGVDAYGTVAVGVVDDADRLPLRAGRC